MSSVTFGPAEITLMLGGLVFFATLMILLVWSLVWVYRDANVRGKPGWAVALLCFLCEWPVSLLLWLVVRPDHPGIPHGKP